MKGLGNNRTIWKILLLSEAKASTVYRIDYKWDQETLQEKVASTTGHIMAPAGQQISVHIAMWETAQPWAPGL